MRRRRYIKDIRRRDPEIEKGWGRIATPFPFPQAEDHKTFALWRKFESRSKKPNFLGGKDE